MIITRGQELVDADRVVALRESERTFLAGDDAPAKKPVEGDPGGVSLEKRA